MVCGGPRKGLECHGVQGGRYGLMVGPWQYQSEARRVGSTPPLPTLVPTRYTQPRYTPPVHHRCTQYRHRAHATDSTFGRPEGDPRGR